MKATAASTLAMTHSQFLHDNQWTRNSNIAYSNDENCPNAMNNIYVNVTPKA